MLPFTSKIQKIVYRQNFSTAWHRSAKIAKPKGQGKGVRSKTMNKPTGGNTVSIKKVVSHTYAKKT